MNRETTTKVRRLSLNELFEVSGGVINEGSHGVQTHVAGRLGPDDSEQGTLAGTILQGDHNRLGL